MPDRVVGVLGKGLVDPNAPLLRPDDLGVLRGDGVFETVRLANGRPHALAAHLVRLAASAAALDLPSPDLAAWRRLVARVAAAWGDSGEAAIRLVLTRGVDGADEPTAFAMAAAIPERVLRQRGTGVRVVTMTRGLASSEHADAPWLLAGVKTTSYAVNMSAQRHALAAGADDVIFVSTDGFVLEAPTATVVWAVGETLHTPPVDLGILAGTTVRTLFENAASQGFTTAVSRSTVDDLHAADAVWLVSSTRGAIAVSALDGRARGDGDLTARVQAAVDDEPSAKTVALPKQRH